MSDTLLFSLVMLGSVFISACAQILLKQAANKTYASRIKEYMNPRVVIAYGIFFASSLLTMFSLRVVPLAFAPVIESCSYVFVAVLGYFMLHEKLNRKKVLGLALIVAGVVVFAL